MKDYLPSAVIVGRIGDWFKLYPFQWFSGSQLCMCPSSSVLPLLSSRRIAGMTHRPRNQSSNLFSPCMEGAIQWLQESRKLRDSIWWWYLWLLARHSPTGSHLAQMARATLPERSAESCHSLPVATRKHVHRWVHSATHSHTLTHAFKIMNCRAKSMWTPSYYSHIDFWKADSESRALMCCIAHIHSSGFRLKQIFRTLMQEMPTIHPQYCEGQLMLFMDYVF